MSLDISAVRAHFPALADGFIFADNAGGTQIVKDVADRIYDYLLHSNVQVGAGYSTSVLTTRRLTQEAPEAVAQLFNAASKDEIILNLSSTLNIGNLTRGIERSVQMNDEFIVTGEHEANAGPWKKLAERVHAVIKYWKPTPTNPNNPYSVKYKVEDLLPLITSNTRIIAFTATSNILGSVVPVKEIIKAARADAFDKGVIPGRLEFSVDCVAYAPHRLIDVQDWDVDYCVLSFYKVYGPHISALYVRSKALKKSIKSIHHYFLDVKDTSAMLQPDGPSYELGYGVTGVIPYLKSLTPAADLKSAFDAIAKHEQTLVVPLLAYLTDPEQEAKGVRIVGEEKAGLSRVPTISFVVVAPKSIRSKDIVEVFDKKGEIGIRCSHFYAYGLLDSLEPKLDMEEGVVRISLVHYNTVEEVERIIEILKEILA